MEVMRYPSHDCVIDCMVKGGYLGGSNIITWTIKKQSFLWLVSEDLRESTSMRESP